MPENNRYPNINIRSKNELAKRISGSNFTHGEALILINDVLANYDKYWRDNIKASDFKNEKYVRTSYGNPLGKLLNLINKKVLAPTDKILPDFIFGGVSKKNHIQASLSLLGGHRKRIKLGADIRRFFEQNDSKRIEILLNNKCGCSKKASKLIANLCCVSVGQKNSNSKRKTIARGFATSTRLATLCNLDLFLRVSWAVKKMLKGHNPRLTIYVDDIGISAYNVSEDLMNEVYDKIESILKNYDTNHSLLLNDKKNISSYTTGNVEHLGLKLCRNKVIAGANTLRKRSFVKEKLKDSNTNVKEKRSLIAKEKSYRRYDAYIKKLNTERLIKTNK
ncbi:MAG: hypothetical protein WC467_04370 [Patescibacteria group bacterium]